MAKFLCFFALLCASQCLVNAAEQTNGEPGIKSVEKNGDSKIKLVDKKKESAIKTAEQKEGRFWSGLSKRISDWKSYFSNSIDNDSEYDDYEVFDISFKDLSGTKTVDEIALSFTANTGKGTKRKKIHKKLPRLLLLKELRENCES